MSNPLDISNWKSDDCRFKPVTIVDIIVQLNKLRAEVMRLTAERDEARTWTRRLLAELHRVTDERDAMRSQLQALAEARYAGEED